MLIDDLKTYLVAQGVTCLIHCMVEPDTPDECITLIDTGGYQPDLEAPLRDPTVQVLTRAAPWDYPRAKELAEQVFNLLHSKGGLRIGSAFVYFCEALQDVTPIGTDGQNRWEVTCNYHFKTRSVN